MTFTSAIKLPTVAEIPSQVPAGWTWLLRGPNNPGEECFCHMHEIGAYPGPGGSYYDMETMAPRMGFKVYRETPEQAFIVCLSYVHFYIGTGKAHLQYQNEGTKRS